MHKQRLTHMKKQAGHDLLHPADIEEQEKSRLGWQGQQKVNLAGEHARLPIENKRGKYDPVCGRRCMLWRKEACTRAACD